MNFVVLTICNISKEWHQSDPEVQRNIEQHLHLNSGGQTAFNPSTGLKDHHSQQSICKISDTVFKLAEVIVE